MAAELESEFVTFITANIVMKAPSARTAMDQMPDVVFLATPKTNHPATLAFSPPKLRVEVPIAVERSGEPIAMERASDREFRRSSEVE